MSFDQILILATGIASILFIYLYFFGKKDDVHQAADNVIAITVDGGYSPSVISVKKSQPVTLKIFRTDPSSCLDQLIIPQWNIVKALPLNKKLEVHFTPDEVGEFPFHCGMNMFHGKIIVNN
jgi:plastocyanin domain-containing protein